MRNENSSLNKILGKEIFVIYCCCNLWYSITYMYNINLTIVGNCHSGAIQRPNRNSAVSLLAVNLHLKKLLLLHDVVVNNDNVHTFLGGSRHKHHRKTRVRHKIICS